MDERNGHLGDGDAEEDRILLEDTGESLDSALAEEERSAIAAAEE